MSNTDRDSMLERWADGMEKLEQYYEDLYGPPATPATLPSVTDCDGMLEAIAEGLERARVNINKHSTTYHDTKMAYTKAVPANTKEASIEKIGGKTIVWNQLCGDADLGAYVTYGDDRIYTVSGTFSSTQFAILSNIKTVADHKYYVSFVNNSNSDNVRLTNGGNIGIDVYGRTGPKKSIRTATGAGYIYIRLSAGTYDFTAKCKVIDLTLMFGEGNEPATAEEVDTMFPAETYAYNEGTLLSAGVTNVVSKDGSNSTIDTYDVPAAVQALAGYGLSCPGHQNYIDFVGKKFVQEVGSRTYVEGDESDSTVITDGTNTNYPLTTPVETDISAYVTDDIRIDVEAGGTLTFPNGNGDDYRIPVPSIETFWVEI